MLFQIHMSIANSSTPSRISRNAPIASTTSTVVVPASSRCHRVSARIARTQSKRIVAVALSDEKLNVPSENCVFCVVPTCTEKIGRALPEHGFPSPLPSVHFVASRVAPTGQRQVRLAVVLATPVTVPVFVVKLASAGLPLAYSAPPRAALISDDI